MLAVSNQKETAWAGGLFQGSGNAGFSSRVLRAQLTLTSRAGQPRPEALERFHRAIDKAGNLQRGRPYGSGRRFEWTWAASNAEAAQVIELFLPYLYGPRQDMAIRALKAFWERRAGKGEDEAWAAGLFQASGSLGFYRSRTTRVLRAQLQLTSDPDQPRPDALERFFRVVDEAGSLGNASRYRTGRLAWNWTALNDDAERVITTFRPYLHDAKREKALTALEAFRDWRASRGAGRRRSGSRRS
jgi:hypothetical protein